MGHFAASLRSFPALASLFAFCLLAPCEGAEDLFPEITLVTPRIQTFGLLHEPYSDPGYECYNPGQCYVGNDCPEGLVDVDVEGQPDLTKYVT